MKRIMMLMLALFILPINSFANEANVNIKIEKEETSKTVSAAIFSERIPREKYDSMVSKYTKGLLNKSNMKIPCKEVQDQFDNDMLNYVNNNFSYEKFLEFASGNMANNFTVEELKIILEFYKTDAGKKLSRFDNGFKMMTSQQIHGYIRKSYVGLGVIYGKYSDTKKMCKILDMKKNSHNNKK